MLAARVLGSQLNPFLQHLRDSGVEVLDRPVFIDSTCGDLWRVHGTLCGYESLKKFALAQREKLRQSIIAYNGLVSKMAPSVVELVEHILKHAAPVGDCLASEASPGCLLKKIREVRAAPYYQIFANLTARPAEYDATVERCWNEMDKIRSNSLCAICSADASKYFLHDKVLVSQAICEAALQTCQQYFTDSKNFFYLLFLIDEALKQFLLSRVSALDFAALRFDETSRMGQTLKDSQICVAIQNYTNASIHDSAKVNATASLCEKTLKIHDEPFLNTTERFLELIEPTIKLSFSHVKKLLKRDRNQPRLLQADSSGWTVATTGEPATSAGDESVQNLEKMYLGDVVMVPEVQASTDSSYTSYTGANGTSGNELSQNMPFLPINMTTLFP